MNELLKQLDEWIALCKEQEQMFKGRGMEASQSHSEAMRIAYMNVKATCYNIKEFIEEKQKRFVDNLEEVEVWERFYDNDTDPQGNKKPNSLLGVFQMTQEWKELYESDYAFKTFGIKDGELYRIVGTEVSGYYNPGLGGAIHHVEKMSETEDIRAWEIFRTMDKSNSTPE